MNVVFQVSTGVEVRLERGASSRLHDTDRAGFMGMTASGRIGVGSLESVIPRFGRTSLY